MKTFSMNLEQAEKVLKGYLQNPDMATPDAYSPDSEHYPDGRISFVDQHLRYLKTHKNVDPTHYLSNLSLMIKKRG